MAPLKHSTRNNFISEALLQENLTITNLSNQSVKITLVEDILKFTCLDCNFVSKEKEHMTNHVITIHNETGLSFICGVCDHKFKGAEDYNTYVNTHESKNFESDESQRTDGVRCDEWGNEFKNDIELNTHIQVVHNNKVSGEVLQVETIKLFQRLLKKVMKHIRRTGLEKQRMSQLISFQLLKMQLQPIQI